MSALPFLTSTRIDVPRPACSALSRSYNPVSKRAMTASMPRGAKPAPATCTPEFLAIPRMQRISVENKIDDLLRGVSFNTVEFETIPNLIICLKERKRKAVLKGDYPLSQTVENMINKLISMQLQKRYQSIKSAKLNELNYQLAQAQEVMKDLVEKWNKKVEEFNNEQAESSASLEKKHISKLEEYDASVPKALPANYCKLSSHLLDLRETERQLVLTRRYDEATALKKQCDKMEKEEAAVQKDKFVKIIAQRRQKLIEEQAKAVECFKIRWTRQSEKLLQEREDEITTQQKIIENIQLKIEETESEEFASK